jgi:hypothetical protein
MRGWMREREIYCAPSSPETRQQQPHHFSSQMLAFVLYNMRTAFLTKRPARLRRRRCEFHYGIVYQKVMSTFVGNQISGCLRATRTWPKKRFHSGLRLKSTANVILVSSNFHKQQEKTHVSANPHKTLNNFEVLELCRDLKMYCSDFSRKTHFF